MLYELWRAVATERRNQLALCDLASGWRLTFGDLFAAGEAIRVGANRFVFPQGHSAEFILAVLAAWRMGKIVCPLERGQIPPAIGGDAPLPDIVHPKTTSAPDRKSGV